MDQLYVEKVTGTPNSTQNIPKQLLRKYANIYEDIQLFNHCKVAKSSTTETSRHILNHQGGIYISNNTRYPKALIISIRAMGNGILIPSVPTPALSLIRIIPHLVLRTPLLPLPPTPAPTPPAPPDPALFHLGDQSTFGRQKADMRLRPPSPRSLHGKLPLNLAWSGL